MMVEPSPQPPAGDLAPKGGSAPLAALWHIVLSYLLLGQGGPQVVGVPEGPQDAAAHGATRAHVFVAPPLWKTGKLRSGVQTSVCPNPNNDS